MRPGIAKVIKVTYRRDGIGGYRNADSTVGKSVCNIKGKPMVCQKSDHCIVAMKPAKADGAKDVASNHSSSRKHVGTREASRHGN